MKKISYILLLAAILAGGTSCGTLLHYDDGYTTIRVDDRRDFRRRGGDSYFVRNYRYHHGYVPDRVVVREVCRDDGYRRRGRRSRN